MQLAVDTARLDVLAGHLMKPLFTLLAGNGHSPPPLVDIDLTVLVQFVIFVMLLLVLTKFVFRPYLAIRRERDENIDGARQRAGDLAHEAEEKMNRYDDLILTARKEAATVRAEYRRQAEAHTVEVLGEARKRAEEKVSAARAKLEQDAAQAQQALKARADEMGRTIAKKLLGREV